ncbi:MAG: hypothetical protein JWM32_1112 [Verrucomicrobia bacterium]|nr:hypothetical protein [Verrucomicrobiota bacterium]
MSHTRRQFLRSGFTFGAALIALRGITSAGSESPAVGKKPGAARGLLFDDADLPRIRANVQRPEFREFWDFMTKVDFAAEEKFLTQELRFTNHITDMSRAQVIMLRSAFVHVITPDPKHVALARAALGKLLQYPRWDWLRDSQQRPVAVMRGAGTCIGLALVSEWLAAELSPEEQSAIDRGMAIEGGPSCYRGLYDMTHHDEAGPWSINVDEEGLPPISVARWPHILDETNLRIVCTAGLAASASHLQARNPDVEKWVAMTRDSLRRYANGLPKDGSFPEGVGYWDYTFSHYIFALELLRRKFGIDDRGLVDFPAQARFTLEMTMPTIGHPDDCISIGDSASAAGAVPLTWIAREYRDANAQRQLLQPNGIRPAWTTAWAAIWFDPSVPAQLPPDARLDRQQALGIVISRTGWSQTDTVVTLRSGNPVNHEHADRNSVIFTAHGERLLNDPVHAAYSTKDPKWLLRQTEAHTSVLIDGKGHVYHDGRDGTNSSPARATIQDYRVGPGWMTVTSDATDAYRRADLPVSLVQRTLIYLKPDVLAIFDRVILEHALPVQARFQAFNEDSAAKVSTTDNAGNGFFIERPHAGLHASVKSAGEFTIVVSQLALPESSGLYPFAELRSASATEHTFLTVSSAAPRGAMHGAFAIVHEGNTWAISGTHRGQPVQVKLVTAATNAAPAITI